MKSTFLTMLRYLAFALWLAVYQFHSTHAQSLLCLSLLTPSVWSSSISISLHQCNTCFIKLRTACTSYFIKFRDSISRPWASKIPLQADYVGMHQLKPLKRPSTFVEYANLGDESSRFEEGQAHKFKVDGIRMLPDCMTIQFSASVWEASIMIFVKQSYPSKV